jgi:hypothetical protein
VELHLMLTYLEGQHWVLAGLFPICPHRNQKNTNDQRGNHLRRLPLCSNTASQGEWDQYTSKHGNHQDDPNDIQMPEKLYHKTTTTDKIQRALIGLQLTGSLCTTVDDKKDSDQRDGANGVNDGEHADSPLPGSYFENGSC